jgi:VIT1/CCC1 family predicted Fe2+/Mn2+ transporter
MNNLSASGRLRIVLPVVLGLTDGILTALTLAAGQLTEPSSQIPLGRAFRIATAALVSGAFVFYVAHYAQLRRELLHAEKQLNVLSSGRLATTRLGRSVLIEAFSTAVLSSAASFAGALIPLLSDVLIPEFRWGAVAASIVALGLLGIGLARGVRGSYWRWCGGLMVGGLLVSIIGVRLHIV